MDIVRVLGARGVWAGGRDMVDVEVYGGEGSGVFVGEDGGKVAALGAMVFFFVGRCDKMRRKDRKSLRTAATSSDVFVDFSKVIGFERLPRGDENVNWD